MQFDDDVVRKAKTFIALKSPRTDLERLLCLAYCLSKFGNEPEFNGTNLSALNSALELGRFTNQSFVVRKAVKRGYLDVTAEDRRRLTTEGVVLVESLQRGPAEFDH